MAGVRYRAEFTSQTGIDYKLEIYDNDYTGSVNTFTVGAEGYSRRLGTRGEAERIGVFGAEVIVHAINLDAGFNGMLSQMATADEDRFILNIYKDTVFHWSGGLLMDLYTEEDRPKSRVDLTFTDGLARLKNIEYNNSGTAYTGDTTVIEHIWNCLNQLPQFAQWGASDVMLSTIVHYFDTQMTYSTSTDPLEFIRIPHESFYSIDTNGNYNYKSCYDVLEQIALRFIAQFKLDNGKFYLVQTDEFRQFSIKEFEYFPDSTTPDQTTTTNLRTAVDQTRTGLARLGGRYEYFAGLKQVEVVYLHNTSGNFLNQPLVLNAADRNLGNVGTNGGDARFYVKGTLKLLVATSASQVINVRVKLKVKQGSYYLKRDANSAIDNTDYSGIQWTTDSTDTVQFYTGVVTILTTGTVTVTKLIPVDFATPYLQNAGDVEVSIESLTASDVFAVGGNTITTGVTLSGDFTGFIEYKTDDNAESERTYIADNSGTGSYSRVLKIKNSVFGDEINSSTKNALEVYNGSSWVASSTWKKKNTGTAYALLQLGVNELLSMQRTGVQKLYCDLRGDASSITVLDIGSVYYTLLSGEYVAGLGIWRGAEYVKTSFDNAGLVTNSYSHNTIEDAPSNSGSFGNQGTIDQTTELTALSANIIDGDNNVSIGVPIGGDHNVNVGGSTPTTATGSYNYTSLENAGSLLTTGDYNIFLGRNAGRYNTGGSYNVFLGRNAGNSNTTGEYNIFLGNSAGTDVTTGLNNIFIGRNAGSDITTTSYNIGIGFFANSVTSGGAYNISLGYRAGYDHDDTNYNLNLGFDAGREAEGDYNVFIGRSAGQGSTGDYNILLGRNADSATYNNCLVIGRDAVADKDNQIVFGDALHNLGAVTNETVTVDYTWEVKINDTIFKIPMYRVP